MKDLVRIADQAAQRFLARHGGTEAIFLTSSVARGQHTATSDIDLKAVVESPPARGLKKLECWLEEGVLVECGFLLGKSVRDLDSVLADATLSSCLVDAIPLHDPEGRIRRLQEAVAARFHEPRYVRARAVARLESARQLYCRALAASAVEDRLFALVAALRMVISVPLLLSLHPLTGRRGLVVLRQSAAVVGHPELFDATLELAGGDRIEPASALSLIRQSDEIYTVAAALQRSPWTFDGFLNPLKRRYRVFGMLEMVAQGHHREIVHPLLQILYCAYHVLTTEPLVNGRGTSARKQVEDILAELDLWRRDRFRAKLEVLGEILRILESLVEEVGVAELAACAG